LVLWRTLYAVDVAGRGVYDLASQKLSIDTTGRDPNIV